MKKKILLTIALCMTLNCTTVFAEDTGNVFASSSDILNVTYDNSVTVLTLDEAIAKAISNSTTLKKADANIILSEDERETVWNNYTYHSSESDGFSELLAVLQYDINYSNSLLSFAQQKDAVRDSMKSAYISLINSQRSLILQEESLKIAEAELVITRLKANLGMITAQELANGEMSYANSKENYESQKTSLSESYGSFNTLIGVKSETTYILELDPIYEDLSLTNSIDSYITVRLASSSNIKQKQSAVEMAEQELKLFFGSNSSYASLKNNVSSASLTLQDAKDQLSSSIRSTYNSIINLETSYKNNLIQLEILKNELAVAEKKYELDLATEFEVKSARYNLVNLESTIISQVYEHMLLVDRIENVDLL